MPENNRGEPRVETISTADVMPESAGGDVSGAMLAGATISPAGAVTGAVVADLDLPYTVASCGMSLDGYLSGPGEERLLLSNDADFDRVDEVRAGCDAILVGASTVRRDDPRLVIRSPQRRAARVARGLAPSPVKVTMTVTAELDPCANFFTQGQSEKIVYCAPSTVDDLRARLDGLATVVAVEPLPSGRVDPRLVAVDLATRGVRRLMVEGGGTVHTQFLTAGLVDELHLVVAPFFVGDSRARRFVGDGCFPWHAQRRATLAEVRQIGDVVLLRYALSERFDG